MKKLVVILCVAIMISLLFVGTMYKDVNTDYLRIHIRANSNYDIDISDCVFGLLKTA